MTAARKADRMSADNVRACVRCGRQASHTGVFYLVRVDMGIVDTDAARRQHGLEVMMGSPGIAAVLGDRDVIERHRYGTGEAHVCAMCLSDVMLAEVMAGMEADGEDEP